MDKIKTFSISIIFSIISSAVTCIEAELVVAELKNPNQPKPSPSKAPNRVATRE